jgi:hypothetical protein
MHLSLQGCLKMLSANANAFKVFFFIISLTQTWLTLNSLVKFKKYILSLNLFFYLFRLCLSICLCVYLSLFVCSSVCFYSIQT